MGEEAQCAATITHSPCFFFVVIIVLFLTGVIYRRLLGSAARLASILVEGFIILFVVKVGLGVNQISNIGAHGGRSIEQAVARRLRSRGCWWVIAACWYWLFPTLFASLVSRGVDLLPREFFVGCKRKEKKNRWRGTRDSYKTKVQAQVAGCVVERKGVWMQVTAATRKATDLVAASTFRGAGRIFWKQLSGCATRHTPSRQPRRSLQMDLVRARLGLLVRARLGLVTAPSCGLRSHAE